MDNQDKTYKILKKFLESYQNNSFCRTWVDNEPDEDGNYWVYMVLDKDWYYSTKPDFIVRRMVQGLKSDIKKWVGFEVEVGITFEDCGTTENTNNINEDISSSLKRRLSSYNFDEELKNILEYEMNPYLYDKPVYFIEDVCDNLVNNLIDTISDYTPTPKEKDELYYYFSSQYSDKILKEFKKANNNREQTNESNKKIIVTESQYKRLFEEKQNKKIFFQEWINKRLSFVRRFCDKELVNNEYVGDVSYDSCDNIDAIESIIVNDVQKMNSARTDMYGNLHDSTSSIHLKITVNYSSAMNVFDFDDLIYDFKHSLIKTTAGLPIIISYEVNNLFKNKDW